MIAKANSMKAVEGVEGKEIINFGTSEKNDYYAKNIRQVNTCSSECTLSNVSFFF